MADLNAVLVITGIFEPAISKKKVKKKLSKYTSVWYFVLYPRVCHIQNIFPVK